MKRILFVLLIIVSCVIIAGCKKGVPEDKQIVESKQDIQIEALDVGAEYINERLGFRLALTEYWYRYTKIVEYDDYMVFVFSGETDLAKDKPVLYIGKPEAFETLGLVQEEKLGDNAVALNSALDAVVADAESGNRDVGIIGILVAEKEQVLGTYEE